MLSAMRRYGRPPRDHERRNHRSSGAPLGSYPSDNTSSRFVVQWISLERDGMAIHEVPTMAFDLRSRILQYQGGIPDGENHAGPRRYDSRASPMEEKTPKARIRLTAVRLVFEGYPVVSSADTRGSTRIRQYLCPRFECGT